MQADQVSVVVTGLGATTPLGGDIASTWSAMLAGTAGVQRSPTAGWRTSRSRSGPGPRSTRRRCLAAWPPAGWTAVNSSLSSRRGRRGTTRAHRSTARPARGGVSSGIGGMSSTLNTYDTLREQGWQRVSPFTRPDAHAERLRWLDQPGTACPRRCAHPGERLLVRRGGHRVRHRDDPLRAGGRGRGGRDRSADPRAARRVVRRDAGPVHPECRAGAGLAAVRQGQGRFRPWRGCGHVVLESAEHAARRGAQVIAVAAGAGYSADAHHIAQPEPDGVGAAAAMRHALADAGVAPEQVMHVNAHATSTPAGDVLEVLAIAVRSAARPGHLQHQVDDRSPDRGRGRARGRGGHLRAAGPGRAAHHQPGRSRRRDRRASTSRPSRARCTTAGTRPWPC